MGKTIFKITLLLAAMAMIAIGVSFLFPAKLPPAPKTLPTPNGYDVFVSAGKLLPSRIGDPNKLSHEQLEAFIAANSNALQVARGGLGIDCQIPLKYTVEYPTNHSHEMIAIRYLGQTFAAEGRLAELVGQTNRAVNAYLDAVQLGYSIRQGGLMFDSMIGTAISGLGATHLRRLCNYMDAASCGGQFLDWKRLKIVEKNGLKS